MENTVNYSLRNLMAFVLVIAAAVAIYMSLNSFEYNRDRVQYIIHSTRDNEIKQVLFIVWMNDLSTTRYFGRLNIKTGDFELLSSNATYLLNGREQKEYYLLEKSGANSTDSKILEIINSNSRILAKKVNKYPLNHSSNNQELNVIEPGIPSGYISQLNGKK